MKHSHGKNSLSSLLAVLAFSALAALALPASGQEPAQPPPAPQPDIEVPQSGDGGDAEPSGGAAEGETGGEPEEGMVNLRSGMTLKEMVKTISEITSEVYLLSDQIADRNITIITPEGGFRKESAFRMFEILLDMNGYSVITSGGVNKIILKRDIRSENVPLSLDLDSMRGSQKFVMKLIKLKNVEARGITDVLRSYVSRDGLMRYHAESNTLVVIDTQDKIDMMVQVVDDLDSDKKIEVVRIRNSNSADVVYKLLEIFNPKRPAQPQSQKGAKEGFVSGTSDLLGFKLINDERTNSVVVIADPRDMSLIKDTIAILDVESEHIKEGIQVIPVRNADAEQIIEVLANLFSGGGSAGAGRPAQTSQSGSAQSSSRLGGGISGGANIGGLGSTGSGIQRQQGGRTSASLVVSSPDGLRITSDPATNSIIVIGSVTDYRMIRQIVEKLDVRRKQVFVEAAILEVGLDNLHALGTNFGLGLSIEGDNLGFVGQQLPGIPSLLGVAADSSIAATSLGSLSGLFLGVVGEKIDPDSSGPLPAIPSFSAVFQAINSVTDVNVLSTPSIITTDNEPAEIVVADVIPFPMGSTVGTSGVTVQTIERLPVGIRLNIKPQISDGEYLNLNIVTEVSSTREAPSGLNTAQFGIATTTRSADSSVIVKNGQTLIIGGLVQDREEVLYNKTPLLGDIPLIGNLFRFKRTQSRKLNLMILLTPRIVESERDMKRLLMDYQKKKTMLHGRGLNTLQ